MDKIVNHVYSTMDYDKFKFMEGNRPVNPDGRPDLMLSFKKRALENPIHVNDKFEIIDGQNTFTCRRLLRLPIYYEIHHGWGIEEVSILNSNTKNWIASDFVNSYITQGLKEYERYKEFDDTYGFGTPVNIMLLTGGGKDGGAKYDKFKNGELKITSWQFAHDSAQKIIQFKDFYIGYKRNKFVQAMIFLFKNKDYSHKVMMTKVQYLSRRIVHCASTDDYIEMMKEIYNHKNHGGVAKL